ncbi:hypothetical protein EDC35_102199 [Thiobaca trueperi]|uniref:Asparagine synthase (Glutamine-hydrolysing) n=2 Tax=Thiobaca trueperi TaxID=127458 RepID=A0A4R3N1E2_9GAMM|nr:hypothetical protein EDC35_102199 [Thiobaca trueperi]
MVAGLADQEIERELPMLEMLLHFQYDIRSVHRLRPGLCLLHYAKDNYFYTAGDQEFVRTDDSGAIRSITLLQGYAWRNDSRTGSRPLSAAQIADLIAEADQDAAAVRARLNGEYAILHLQADGSCLAFNDLLGIEHIYVCQRRGLTILANRVALAAHLAGDHDWDIPNLLWLPLVGYRIGEGTRSPQVRMMPQGAHIRIRDGQLAIREDPCFMVRDFPDRATLRNDDDLFERIVARGIDASLASLTATFDHDGPIVLPITGGKDSRLGLAFALQVFPVERLRLFTNGSDDHPDVIVGRMVAERLGLPHETRQPAPVRDTTQDANDLLRRLAIHAFQNDGMFGAWDLKAHPRAGNGVISAGFVGGVFKGYLPRPFHFDALPDPAQFIASHGPYDPLKLFRPGAREPFDQTLRERFANYCVCTNDYNDIPDLLHLKERLPNWFGGARRLDAYSNQVVNILNNEYLIKLAFALDYRERQQHVIHFRLLRQLAPQLLDVPFAAQSWNPELKRHGADPRIFREPVTAPPTTPLHGSWQYTINRNPDFRLQLRELFGAFPNSPIWDYLDRDALLAKLTQTDFSMQPLISLYGLCTVFMAVHAYWLPLKMAAQDGRPDPNIVRVRNPLTKDTYRLRGEQLEICQDVPDQPAIHSICTHLMTGSAPTKPAAAAPPIDNKVAPADEGYVDRVQGNIVTGWAWHPANPDARVQIDVIDPATGQWLDDFVADTFRGDLLRAGKGDGRYAFRYDLQRIRERLTGSVVAFRIKDSGFELKRSPVTLA